MKAKMKIILIVKHWCFLHEKTTFRAAVVEAEERQEDIVEIFSTNFEMPLINIAR